MNWTELNWTEPEFVIYWQLIRKYLQNKSHQKPSRKCSLTNRTNHDRPVREAEASQRTRSVFRRFFSFDPLSLRAPQAQVCAAMFFLAVLSICGTVQVAAASNLSIFPPQLNGILFKELKNNSQVTIRKNFLKKNWKKKFF